MAVVGYILMQVPSNMLLAKIKYPSWYIAGAMLIWGMIVSLMDALARGRLQSQT
jgi:hypothetical protein